MIATAPHPSAPPSIDRIDNLADELYELTDDELAIVEAGQA
jgi:hypothetical protein